MLPRLNGLRAIAILLVLLVHGVFFLTSSIIGTGILSVIDGGEMGVCIFFALSGFLITRACLKLKSGEVPVYFRKRVAKILPPFYLSLSLALIFQIWTQAPEPWKQLLEQTANFILFLEPMHPVGPHWYADVYWTLSLEVMFYFIAPCVILIVGARRKWVLPIVLATISVGAICWFALRQDFPAFRISLYIYFAWGSVAACLPASLFRAKAPRGLHAALAVLMVLLVGLAGWSKLHNGASPHQIMVSGEPDRFLYDIIFGGIVAVLMLPWPLRPESLTDRVLASRALGFIALISYELYLFHKLILGIFHYAMGMEDVHGNYLDFFVLRVVAPLSAIPVAAVVYFYFSRPLHDWIISRGRTTHVPRREELVKT